LGKHFVEWSRSGRLMLSFVLQCDGGSPPLTVDELVRVIQTLPGARLRDDQEIVALVEAIPSRDQESALARAIVAATMIEGGETGRGGD
jgi:hypothetical protein